MYYSTMFLIVGASWDGIIYVACYIYKLINHGKIIAIVLNILFQYGVKNIRIPDSE